MTRNKPDTKASSSLPADSITKLARVIDLLRGFLQPRIAPIAGGLLLLGLYLSSLYSYLLFHTLAEMFSIVISGSLFLLLWNARQRIDNQYILFIGLSTLFVSTLDLIHTLAYSGMPIFVGYDANLPTQLWIAARYMQGISLLLAVLFINRPVPIWRTMLAQSLITLVIIVSIFARFFPVCYVTGVGLTDFKKVSEYVIIGLLIAASWGIWRSRHKFASELLRLLIIAYAFTIGAELAFTSYISVYGQANLIGHLFKIVASIFWYYAIVRTGILHPIDVLFRKIRDSESNLHRAENIAQIGNWEYRLAENKIRASVGARRVYGLLGEEWSLAEMRQIPLPKYRPVLDAALKSLIEDAQPYNIEFSIRRSSDGQLREIHSIAEYDAEQHIVFGIIHDITDRKLVEEALRESENRLQNVFETMSEGVILIAPDGQIVQANSAAEHILGISRPEIKSRNYITPDWAIIRPDGTPMPPDEMAGPRAMQEKRPIKDTVMGVRRPDGSVSWINVSASPLGNSAGELDGVVGTFADITYRKKIEEVLSESEARFRTFIQNAPVAVALGRNGMLLYANPMYVKMHGFQNVDELIGQPTLERIAPQSRAESIERSHRRNQGLPIEKQYELFALRKDGTYFPMLAAVTQITLADGPANIGFFQDITERKQMEDDLRKNHIFLSEVIENSGVSIFAKDREGHYELVNGKWEEETGLKREFAFGKTDLDLFPGDLGKEFRKNDLLVIEQGIAVKTEEELESADGKRFFVTIKLPLRDKNDVVTGLCGIATEITDRKRAADQLREAHDLLEQRVLERTAELQAANSALEIASRLKDEFLATISHELRTPLTGILGLSQVLQLRSYGELNEKQIIAIHNIENSGQKLLDLINEILDFSKLQSGKLDLQLAPCSLASICNASLQMVNNLAEKKQQHLNFSISPEIITINADERRIRQIVINLLSNAIKFTAEDGSIDLVVTGSLEAQQVRISVSDTGIGIKAEDFPRLFQPFIQLDAGLSRKYNGTGLGLSLVKNMAEMHGGKVNVESVFGQGSCFTVILPWRLT